MTGGPFPGGGPGFGPGGFPGGGLGPGGGPGGVAGGGPRGGNGVPGGIGFTGAGRVGLPMKSDSRYEDLVTGPARDIPHLLATSFRGVPSPDSLPLPSIHGSPVRRALGPLGRASNFGKFCTRGVRIGIPPGRSKPFWVCFAMKLFGSARIGTLTGGGSLAGGCGGDLSALLLLGATGWPASAGLGGGGGANLSVAIWFGA